MVTASAAQAGQLQAPDTSPDEEPPAQNLLIDSLVKAAPEAAAAAAAAEASLAAVQGQSSMTAVQQRFLEEDHWHSGSPLEPAIWTETQEMAIMLSKFKTPQELLRCQFLKRYIKRKIAVALQQCRDRQLVANKAEADQHLAVVCSEAISALKDYRPRQEAMNARALHFYASSLSNTTFINRSGPIAIGQAGGAGKPTKHNKKGGAVKGGAEQIKEQNKLRQASKHQVHAAESVVRHCHLMECQQDFCLSGHGCRYCAWTWLQADLSHVAADKLSFLEVAASKSL